MMKRPGPKPNTYKDMQVLHLRREKKTFREIAEELGEDVKTTHERYKRCVELVKQLENEEPSTVL